MANQNVDLASRSSDDEDNPTKAGICNIPFHKRKPCDWLESPQKFAEWKARVLQWPETQVKCPKTHLEAAIESRIGLPGFATIPDAGSTVKPIMNIYDSDTTPGQQEANRAARSLICNVHYTFQLMGFDASELPNLIDVNALFVNMGGRRQVEGGEFQWYRNSTKSPPIKVEDLKRVLGPTDEPLEWYNQSFADMFTGSLSIPSKCIDQWSKMVSIVFKEVSEGNAELATYLRRVGGKGFANFKLKSDKGNCRRCLVPFTSTNKTPQEELCKSCMNERQRLRTYYEADSDYEDDVATTAANVGRRPIAEVDATFRSGATPARNRWQQRPPMWEDDQ